MSARPGVLEARWMALSELGMSDADRILEKFARACARDRKGEHDERGASSRRLANRDNDETYGPENQDLACAAVDQIRKCEENSTSRLLVEQVEKPFICRAPRGRGGEDAEQDQGHG